MSPRRRVRRFVSRISIRLLAFNVLLVFLPAAGIAYLQIYEGQLLQAQEESMVQQGRLLAAALSERGELTTEDVEPVLVRLEQRTTSRLRVIDRDRRLLSDTSRLGPRRGASQVEGSENEEPDLRASWLYRLGSSLFRLVGGLVAEPGPEVGPDYYSAESPFDGSEVHQALEGRYGAATRITPGQRSVTLYSALPIESGGEVIGAVLVSQSTYQILQDLYEVRLAIFRFLLGVVAVAAVVSLMLSATISRPLKRLRSEAAALVDRRGRLTGRFTGSDRLDEIGDLSRALSELSGRLEERMHFIESFAADVSHEFKNPLASIRSAAEMLPDVESPDERARFTRMIEQDISRLEKLLSGVREITLLDAADADDDAEPVDLRALLAGVTEQIRTRSNGARVELLASDAPVYVHASGEHLVRAFENLIDNAVSFAPENGRVRVALETTENEALVRIEDDGPGIPEQHQDRVFERFFTYRPNGSEGKEHSGLGLSIVKAILERSRGSVAIVDSSLGGAAFEVRLTL